MTYKKRIIGILAIFFVAITVAGVSAASPDGERTLSFIAPELALDMPVWQQVNISGFGDSTTDEITALESFNNYLYAGTHNAIDPEPLFDGAQIFRSPDGHTWTAVTQPGFGNAHDTAPPAILDLTVFKGYLYASTGRGNAAQIWRSSNGVNWGPVVNAGFGDPDIVELTVMTEHSGWLYVGATKQDNEAQIWRTFSGDGNLSNWNQVAVGTDPASITALTVFSNTLYAAVQSEAGAPIQIWSSAGGSSWTTVISNGFGDTDNTLTGGMAVFGGYLYLGGGNANSGAQLWRTNDGTNWAPAITPAFGDANNTKVEMLIVFENQLYASVRNTATGMEVWRSSDGSLWEQTNLDGFGDSNNTATNWSNASAKFSNQLYVGTLNANDGGEVWRMQPLYDVSLSTDQFLSGPVGGQVNYSLTVTNTGTMTDSIDLAATGQSWTSSLSTSLVNLNPSTSTTFTVTVEIPPDANDQETDSVTITATSQGDNSKIDTAILTTTSIAAPVYGVALSADQSLSGPVGGQVRYILTITNNGNIADDFNLAPSGHTWTTTLSNSHLHLASSASTNITVSVAIPSDAADQEIDSVTITATSQGDTSKTDTAVLTTTSIAESVYGVALSADDSLTGPAGDQVSYTMTITNTGNVFDTYDLLPSGENWITNLSTPFVSLSPNTNKSFTVTVDIPPGANNQDTDSVTITATSQGDINKTSSAVLTTVSLGNSIKIYLPLILFNSAQ